MVEEESKRGRFRELSYLLDDEEGPLSLSIYNDPSAWSVHVYSTHDEIPVVMTGDDLSVLITGAIEKYRKRRVVSGSPPGPIKKT